MAGPNVVVVGGGIIGCACARELARRGARVTLVERAELAAGASGRNHGLLLTPTDPALVPMARLSLEVYREVAEASPVPLAIDPEPLGFLVVAAEAHQRDAALEQAEAAAAAGVRVERLEGPAVREAEPSIAPDVAEAWLLEDARRVPPAALTVALALDAREAGAEIRRNLPARALLVRGEAVRGVLTDEGVVEADAVVLAAGPWAPSLLRPLGPNLPVVPARGWLVHLGPAPGLLTRVVEEAGWQLLPGRDVQPPVLAADLEAGTPAVEPAIGALMHANPDGTVLVGASRQAAISAEPEDPRVPRAILRRAARLVPGVAGQQVLASWWGIRPMSPDGRPLVGWLRDGLLVAGGHGSVGVTLGGGTARLAAALVLGEEPPLDPEPFRPDRFGFH